MKNFNYLTKCCLCNSDNLKQVIKLNDSPPANELIIDIKNDQSISQQEFPLVVNQCQKCGHHQLSGEVDPNKVFSNYKYVSGTSKVNRKHFEDYVDFVYKKCDLNKSSFIFEIGSNDGVMLSFFQKRVTNVLGIDPAKNIVDKANKDGIPTINDYFTSERAQEIVKKYGKADVIIANNVLAHTSQLQDIFDGINILLDDNGALIFEVSYFLDVLDHTLFDLIYNEHVHQHLLGPLHKFFAKNNMYIDDVDRIPNHGGSIRVCVKKMINNLSYNIKVSNLLELENNIDDQIVKFDKNISIMEKKLIMRLKEIKDSGKTISAYGCPAKATTILHEFNIGKETIDYIFEDNELKQDMLSPGKHIPILSPSMIIEKNPDYLLILAWNFSQSIMDNNKQFMGTWIVPLPELKEYKYD